MNQSSEKDFVVSFTRDFTFKVNIIVLIIHIALLCLFIVGQVKVMVYVNLFSITYYVIILFFSKKHFYLFTRLTCIEVIIHSMLATLTLGWEWGFELYFFAICPIVFYFDYIAIKLKDPGFKPVISTIVVAITLAITALISGFTQAETVFEGTAMRQVAVMSNALISFLFCVYFLYLYKKMAVDSEEIIRNMARKDTLTGLYNRRTLLELLTTSLKDVSTPTRYFVALMDIDDFKKINDTYGHTVGDQVLVEVANILETLNHQGLHVSRWGGEEFLIYGPPTVTYDVITRQLDQVLKTIETKVFYHGEMSFHVTLTAGLALGGEIGEFDQVIGQADSLLYQGKHNGKNQLVT